MKKTVFALSAVSVICACGLVIDPDKLVEGNGTPIDSGVDQDTGPIIDNDTGPPDATPVDAGNDGDILVVVPECVPEKPIGGTGPYAVVTAPANGAPPVCPNGYRATPVEQANGGFTSVPAVCGSTSGCATCTPNGSATCGLRIRTYNDNLCAGKEADDSIPVSTPGCKSLDSEPYYKLEHIVTGLTCTGGGGTTTPTSKPAPTYSTKYVVCEPDPDVPTAKCAGGQVALPPATSAAACVLVPTTQSCAGSYPVPALLSKNAGFTDNRTCTCGCQTSASACTGGTVQIYDSATCSGGGDTLSIGACVQRDSHDTYQQTAAPAPGAAATCEARATPSGEVSATNDLKLCCLAKTDGS